MEAWWLNQIFILVCISVGWSSSSLPAMWLRVLGQQGSEYCITRDNTAWIESDRKILLRRSLLHMNFYCLHWIFLYSMYIVLFFERSTPVVDHFSYNFGWPSQRGFTIRVIKGWSKDRIYYDWCPVFLIPWLICQKYAFTVEIAFTKTPKEDKNSFSRWKVHSPVFAGGVYHSSPPAIMLNSICCKQYVLTILRMSLKNSMG